MEDVKIFGENQGEIGSLDKNLVLRTKGLVYIRFGRKYIELLDSNGNLNIKIPKVIKKIKSSKEILNNGLYILDGNIYAYSDGELIQISGVNGQFISYITELKLSLNEIDIAQKNIGIKFESLLDALKVIEKGIFFVDNKIYCINDGKISEVFNGILSSLNNSNLSTPNKNNYCITWENGQWTFKKFVTYEEFESATVNNKITDIETRIDRLEEETNSNKPSNLLYTIGLLSDIHYQVNNNLQIITSDSGNSSEGDSFFRLDLNKIINIFKDSDVEFVACCGDIATGDINDLVEFTHDYIKYFTGIDTYSGTDFLNNQDYRPFYSSIGNHDHFVVYSDPAYCKYIDYGLSEHDGSRWKSITYNNTVYNCPELLAGTGMIYASNDSKSYYIIPNNHSNHMFIFLSAFYGDMLPTINNPNYNGDRNDNSQMNPHNLLNPNDPDVIAMAQYCNKTNIFTSGNETNMNFMYYKPSDLIWLKETIETNNNSKKIFIFSHYFFPLKAGGGNKYECGSNSMMGLTFHFLNKLNNDYPKTIWFSGHSHFSWKDTTFRGTGDIHYCDKDYEYIDPNNNVNGSNDNLQILSNFNNVNWYQQPSGTRYYDRTNPQVVTNNSTAWNIHLPSMSRPRESDSINANCEAAILEVYNNSVKIYKLGYSTPDGINYTPYSNSLSYRSLTINNRGNGDIQELIPSSELQQELEVSSELSNNLILFIIKNNTNETIVFTGYLKMRIVGDYNETDFCFRNTRYYSSDGSNGWILYKNRSETDKTKVPYNGYIHGANTDQLNPGQSLTIRCSKLMGAHSTSGYVTDDSNISSLFNRYFKIPSVDDPFTIKLSVAIDRSSDEDTVNRLDTSSIYYYLKYTDKNGNELDNNPKIVSKGIYYISIYRIGSLYDPRWTILPYTQCTNDDILNTSYVTVQYN